MKFKPLDVYEPLYFTPEGVRYISACGGRGGGRSHNCSEYLIYKITRPEYFRGLIARAVYSDLKKTTWLEFIDRIDTTEGLNVDDFDINQTEKIIKYRPTGNTITGIGFRKSAGNRKASLKGFANVTDVLIEEAQELAESELNQLDDSLRTTKAPIKIIFAYNMPDKGHVLMKRFFDLEPIDLVCGKGYKVEGFSKAVPKKNRPDHIAIFSSYLDNFENLDKHTIANYERYFYHNAEHYFSEIVGYVSGGAKGVIFKLGRNWHLYKDLPDLEFDVLYGLDFGGGGDLTDEPNGSSKTVFVKLFVNKPTMSIYVKTLIYKGEISLKDLMKLVSDEVVKYDEDGYVLGARNVIADNARQDLINDFINETRVNIIGAKTMQGGSNQVIDGYEIMKKYTYYLHEDDINGQTEFNNHKWDTNINTGEQNGKPSNKFKDFPDAVRYPTVSYHLFDIKN